MEKSNSTSDCVNLSENSKLFKGIVILQFQSFFFKSGERPSPSRPLLCRKNTGQALHFKGFMVHQLLPIPYL